MSASFEGFDIPNTTPVPDIVFDELLGKLTGNELKALLYIIRRTYGFGKNADAISLSQFRVGIKTKDEKVLDRGCGIEHNRTILVALHSLEKKGYVVSKKRQTNAGDSDTTIYKLHFKKSNKEPSGERSDKEVVTSGNHVVTPSNEVVTSGNDGSYSRSRRSLPQVTTVVTPGNTQETVLQYTDSQETVLQGVGNSNDEGNDATAHTPPAISQEESEHHATDTGHPAPGGNVRSDPPEHQQDSFRGRDSATPDTQPTQGNERYAPCDEREDLDRGAAGVRFGRNEVHRHEGLVGGVAQETPPGSSVRLYESDPFAYSLTNSGGNERGGEGVPSARRATHRVQAGAAVQQPHQGYAQRGARQRSDPLESLPENVRAIILAFQRAGGQVTANVREHAETLLAEEASPDEIEECVADMLENDKIFEKSPVYLKNVVNWFPIYRRNKAKKKGETGKSTPASDAPQPPYDENLIFGHDPTFWTEEELSRVRPVVGRAIRTMLAERGVMLCSQQISYTAAASAI